MPPIRNHLVYQDYRTCHHKMWMLGALLLLCDHQQSFRAIAAENEVGRKFANCQCRGILAKTSRLFIEPRMWGSRSKRPLLGGWRRQAGSPLRARVCSLRSPLPIAQLALVPLPSLRPLFLPCLPVRRTRALCPRRGKCGIPNECGTVTEESSCEARSYSCEPMAKFNSLVQRVAAFLSLTTNCPCAHNISDLIIITSHTSCKFADESEGCDKK